VRRDIKGLGYKDFTFAFANISGNPFFFNYLVEFP